MNKRLIVSAIVVTVATMSFAYTAQFHAGAGTYGGETDFYMTEASDGAGVTLPTPVLAGCSGWEFAGWITGAAPYALNDKLTQPLYKAGTLYRLSSISEEFYAVYCYKSNLYHEIYQNDQLVSGDRYLVVNEDEYNATYFSNETASFSSTRNIWGKSLSSLTTWPNGYVIYDINSLDAEYRASIAILTEKSSSQWSLYNPERNRYLDFNNCAQVDAANDAENCSISRTGWNTFSLTGVTHNTQLGNGNMQTGWYIDILGFKFAGRFDVNSTNFYIYRQQTVYTSTPDCALTNYTVTLNPGTKGNVTSSTITESDFHAGIVLPAATLDPSECTNQWEFAGWTESGSDIDESTLPNRLWLAGEVYYPERNETLHAVYRRKSTMWEQVDDPNMLQAGEKILVAYKSGSDYYVLSSAESSAGYNASVAVGGSEITTLDEAACVWLLEGERGAWRLKDANGKHLDMTRSDYAYSYTYPWSRWSDEFTISGVTDFSIRSNYASLNYLTANGTRFSSTGTANSNVHLFRQVTMYALVPSCETYTVRFNSGEGTFDGVTNATVTIENVSAATGISLSDPSVPVADAPDCDEWKFAGWRVGSGLTSTTAGPGILYKTTGTFVPLRDSMTLYAVYQNGDGEIYFDKTSTMSEITAGGVYVIVYNNAKAVTYNNNNSQWSGTDVTITDNKIAYDDVTAQAQWYYDGTKFYRTRGNDTYYLANNNNTSYAGAVTNTNAPYKLQYSTTTLGFITTTYYLRWGGSSFSYATGTSNNTFNIFKQKTAAPTEYNSWPHCTAFSVVLNACGGKFTSIGDTRTLTEAVAGNGVSLNANQPTNDCSWTLAGWVRTQPLQATSVSPVSRLIDKSSTAYVPQGDNDQLYAVYYDGTSIWSSYPSCGTGIEVVAWTEDGVVVETYGSLAGTPTINGVAGTANGDGTYTLPFNVAENPCVPVRIQWGSTSQIVKTPILVNLYSRLSAFVSVFGDCSNCDVVVSEGGTVVVNHPDQRVRDLTVYPGGRLVLEAGRTFTANSLTMRADGDGKMPQAVILGTFNCTSLNHDRRIDNSRYYWMALPYDVTIASINYADATANGKNAVYDTDYYLKFYDGVQRAKDKGKNDSYWVHIGDIEDESYQTKTTLKAGRGYLLGLPVGKQSATGHSYRTLRFPMTVADWSSESSVNKTIAAAGQDCDWPQHIGWNLIGNPFLQNYSAVSAEDLQGGKLVEYYNDQGVWVEPWYTLEEGTEDVPYVTFYNPEDDTYTQTRLVGHNMPPFSTVLVQLQSGKTGLQFDGTAMSSPTSVAARRVGLLNEDDDQTSEIEVFAFSGNGNDRFTVILDDNRSKAYEVGADLLKIHNNGQMNVYAHHNGVECVFDAISHADADSIPVGIIMPQEGQVCMGLSVNKQLPDDIEHIWLIDEKQKIQTDLLLDTYTFETESGANNNRLWLRVQKMTGITTAEQSVYGIGNKPYKFVRDGKLTIQMGSQSYDATGARIR